MNYIKTTLIIAVFAVIPASAFALTTSDNGTSADSATVPATVDNDTSARTAPVPRTADNDTSATTATPPATVDNGTSAATPVTTESNTNTNTSSGSGRSGTGFSTGTHGSNPPAPCVFLTRPLKIGDVGSDVINLQNYLKNTEGISVTVTGTFDVQTVEAVKTLQSKYSQEILAPWGITTPTGSVYMTTIKKINSRVCGGALSLTPNELAEINSYKAKVQGGTSSGSIGAGSSGTNSGTNTSNDSDTSTDTESNQVGAVAKTSVASKIWNFIKRIFGR